MITKENQTKVIEKNYDELDYTGFEYEILEAQQCFLAGKTESDRMPLKESIKIIEIIDQIRQDIGLVYSNDKI